MAASREISALADDLVAEIDRVLGLVVSKIETERKALEHRCLNPEDGWTKTEQFLLDAMLGRLSFEARSPLGSRRRSGGAPRREATHEIVAW